MSVALKSSARVTGLGAEALFAMWVCEGVLRDAGFLTFTITSCTDGTHSPGSKHYVGKAFDIRSRDIPTDRWGPLVVEMKERLGCEFDAVIEKDHFHIEHDPKLPLNSTPPSEGVTS